MVWTTAVAVVLESWIGVVRHRLWIMMIAVGKSTLPVSIALIHPNSRLI